MSLAKTDIKIDLGTVVPVEIADIPIISRLIHQLLHCKNPICILISWYINSLFENQLICVNSCHQTKTIMVPSSRSNLLLALP